MKNNLQDLYFNELKPKIIKDFNLNIMAAPVIEKIVLSTGVNINGNIEESVKHLSIIAGQNAVKTKAKISVAQFSLREGNEIGVKVTLRKAKMYAFLDKLINVAFLNWRSFHGVDERSFNQQKNTICISLGIADYRIFPEVKVFAGKTKGMNITICMKARNITEAQALLIELGMPFQTRKHEGENNG